MNPITKALGYVVAVLIVTQALTGWWLDHDERALGAVPAQIQAARLQDANTAATLAQQALAQRQALNDHNVALARDDQARADAHHEQVMLGIQHRQDLAQTHFEDAIHDAIATAWAAQPVPGDYLLGMCAVIGSAPGCGGPATSGELIRSGSGSGPAADAGGASGPQPYR